MKNVVMGTVQYSCDYQTAEYAYGAVVVRSTPRFEIRPYNSVLPEDHRQLPFGVDFYNDDLNCNRLAITIFFINVILTTIA